MKTVLVIGASRGIGRELARQYHGAGWRVLATARKTDDLAPLRALGAEAIEYDVLNSTPESLGTALGDAALDVAIYNAGVGGPRLSHVSAPSAGEFDTVMGTNVLGALRVVPLLGARVAKTKGTLAFLSSRMGSIGEMSSPGHVVYRASKAALNALVKASAIEWGSQGVTLLALHPGWVKTDMGGAGATLDVATSVSGLRRVIETSWAKGEAHFVDYSGASIAW